jgi:aminoglycoside/choline kinase family phosphotransferase
MEKITKQNLAEHLIQKQLEYVGKTIEDIKLDEKWYNNNTLTKEQYEEWKDYSLKLIKKTIKYRKSIVEREFAMFDLMYGLKVIE